MVTIKINDKEFSCPTKWDEVKCKTYLQLLELETTRDKYVVEFLYTQRFLEILCGVEEGGLDELELEYLASLEPIISEGLSQKNLTDITATVDHFVFNGITYSYYTPETIRKITLGEQAYIETLKQSKDMYDQMIKAAAVMIRPATLITTPEGRTYWKLEKFVIDEVEHRAKMLAENLSTKDMAMLNNFFFDWCNYISITYEALFVQKGTDITPNTGYEINPQYRWLSMIDRFANGDITKYEEVEQSPYEALLGILGYWTERDKKIEFEERQRQKRQ